MAKDFGDGAADSDNLTDPLRCLCWRELFGRLSGDEESATANGGEQRGNPRNHQFINPITRLPDYPINRLPDYQLRGAGFGIGWT